jgi:hypothetical protein
MVARALVLALMVLLPASAFAGSTRCQSTADKQPVCVPGSSGEGVTCDARQKLWSAFVPNSVMVPLFSALLSASLTMPAPEAARPQLPLAPEPTLGRRMPLYLTRNVQLL